MKLVQLYIHKYEPRTHYIISKEVVGIYGLRIEHVPVIRINDAKLKPETLTCWDRFKPMRRKL